MTPTANDTLLLDAPAERRTSPPTRPTVPDRTADLTRIIRRVLRNPGSDTPLSQAIRAALANAAPHASVSLSEDEALRIREVALRMDELLPQRITAPPPRVPHLETVRN